MPTTNDVGANSDILSSWTDVETLTASMRSFAANQNWLDVVEQATARHHLLLAHFERFPVGPENAEFYRQRLGTMLTNEQHLQTIVRDARKSLMSEGAVISHGHRAVGAYLESARR